MSTESPKNTEMAQGDYSFQEHKNRAMEYYSDNGVPAKMEEILNSMYFHQPNDVFGHLASFFDQFSLPPVISKVHSKQVLDGRGQHTIKTEVYAVIKNTEKFVNNSVLSSNSKVPDHAPQAEKDAEAKERITSIENAIQFINNDINEAINGINPSNQEEIDTIIYAVLNKMYEAEREKHSKDNPDVTVGENTTSPPPGKGDKSSIGKRKSAGKGKKGAAVVIIPDEPKEQLLSGCEAVCSVSQAVLKAGAQMQGIPCYKHVASLKYGEIPSEFSLPLPMVTVMSGGRTSLGKLKGVKEFMLIPSPDLDYSKALEYVSNICNYISNQLAAKFGNSARLTTELGSIFPVLDRVEQGLDMLQEAITTVGLSPGTDFNIALNLAAHEVFDYEKGKYEIITGIQKLPEELADFWADLLGRYPSVTALIDPCRRADKQAWMMICEKLSSRCLIVGDTVYQRPALLKEEQLPADFRTSAIVLKMEQMTSISDLLGVSKKMEDAENSVILSCGTTESCDDFLADLALGMSCRYFKIGGPCRGERVAKYNRLLEIESELNAENGLKKLEKQTFSFIKPPTPPPMEDVDTENEKKDADKKSETQSKKK